ncbi:hypothetical protein APSETT444_005907 [Aspergillus pseudonomiae]
MQLPQTIAILALLALASAHAIRRDEAKADFSKTCENITVRKGGNHLEAECTSTNGGKMKSSLDLNFCIRHTYGASSLDSNRGFKDIMVSNNDGLTECYGHRADKI